jgi:hypothetical protein
MKKYFYFGKKPLNYNINHDCWVQLTPIGCTIFLDQLNDQCPKGIELEQWKIKMKAHNDMLAQALRQSTNSDGWTKMQMHALMQIYGRHMCMGGPDLFNSDIRLDRNGYDSGLARSYRRILWFKIREFFPKLLKAIKANWALMKLSYYLHINKENKDAGNS